MARSTQQLPPSRIHRAKSFLAWAFALSLVTHAVLAPIVGRYKPSHVAEREPQFVSLTTRVHVSLPTSPPPTPTPHARPTEAPRRALVPRRTFRADVPRATSHSNTGPTEAQYTSGPGSASGDPGTVNVPVS